MLNYPFLFLGVSISVNIEHNNKMEKLWCQNPQETQAQCQIHLEFQKVNRWINTLGL